jgi:phage/plasmid-like protein (TIGR03299 family)
MTVIFADRNREQGRGYWHQFGEVNTDPAATATDFLKPAGLDYEVIKRPLKTHNSKGHIMTIPNQYAIVSNHGDTEEAIAVVGREYEPIQNRHLAEVLDASGLTAEYQIDVAGATADGRTVFWALKARDGHSINGDEYRDHWLITDGKDGNRALTLALTPVRVVCSNALAMAIAGATIKVGIQHGKSAESELRWWLDIAPKLQAASDKAKTVLRDMGTIKATEDMVERVLDAAYPKPRVRGRAQLYSQLPELQLGDDAGADVERAFEGHTSAALRVLEKRTFTRDLFESYASDPSEANIAGTLLGIVNAVTDVENHRAATTARENVALSNLYGPRYQAQAGAIREALAIMR